MLDWAGAVGQRLILESVVVPQHPEAMFCNDRRAGGEGIADRAPVVSGRLALLLGDEGGDEVPCTQRLGDLGEALRFVPQARQRHVKAQAHKAGIVEGAAERLRVGLVGGQPRFYRIISHRLQLGQMRLDRGKVTRRIKLIRDGIGHQSCGSLSLSNSSSSTITPRSLTVS